MKTLPSKIFLLIALTVLGGCQAFLPKANNLETGAYEGVASYGIATHIANQYLYAPECTSPISALPCSKAALRAQIREADNTAYAAVIQAANAIRNFPHSADTEAKKKEADKAIDELNDITHSKPVTETQK
jgi:hypothetical protein